MFDRNRLISLLIFLITAGCLILPGQSGAAFFEKKFVIKKDLGKDVLCDAYVVQKNDYVTLLLKQRGDIAFRDFPRFLSIFKRLNPNVHDVNIIYPNQLLMIPLKIIAPNSVEGQASGTVTIPVITITNLPERLKQNSEIYEIRYGDWVSKLITQRFGPYNSEAYRQGMKFFKKMNPDIADINLVRAGQKVRLPDPALLEKNRHLAAVKAVEKVPVPLETSTQKTIKIQPIPAVRTVPKALPLLPPVKPIEQAPPPQLAAPIPIPVSAPVPKIKTPELPP
ncbi:MAG: hypothetical protein GXP53_06140, partial [Deltaproteobacteria bacterium]|nr:hypothetical protein [Deltaproteobacteria bacterium]